jgi:hypothetical protein
MVTRMKAVEPTGGGKAWVVLVVLGLLGGLGAWWFSRS